MGVASTVHQMFVNFGKGYCSNWRASEASETLSGVYKFELVRYIYICMEVRVP